MSEVSSAYTLPLERIMEPVRRVWGFDQLRPIQEDAIRAGVAHNDSLVVMPTGGGKSLCYQVPPLIADRTDIVLSPLIALMKDQVDGLRACGYPAVALHSGLTPREQSEAVTQIREGKCKLVFVAPERILSPGFMHTIENLDIRAFAIDEAHCISHWGHDFRPEYRRLAELRQLFPGASLHAYTATATQRVRDDIVVQLQLRDPTILVGTFDRPNLTYRVVPRVDVHQQVADVVRRHEKDAVIVYCLSRKDTERMADSLRAAGFDAQAYHAGMESDKRRRIQEAFADETLNIIAATVAFGMGIDRSNVRCVIHATMPKSIEHYQQETGRAGRDGLEAECVLFYSGGDVMRWKSLFARSAIDLPDPESIIKAQTELLEQMQRYGSALVCRHRMLSEHFDQDYDKSNCQGCDVCLNEMEGVEDATETAQKILSCVARVEQRFGVGQVVDVLLGANTEKVRDFGHDRLSTYGLLKDTDRKTLINWTHQLVDSGLLARTPGDRPVLCLNDASWEVLRGERTVMLTKPKKGKLAKTKADIESWEGVNHDLFEQLCELRRELAQQGGVPAYVIFNDATLRDMARVCPTTPDEFLSVHGVGQSKLKRFGSQFLAAIADSK